MNLSEFFLVSAVLLSIIFSTNQKIFAENWILYGEDGVGTKHFINKDSITEVSPSVKRVWGKEIIDLEVRLKGVHKAIISAAGLSDYSHTLRFWEINCKNKTIGTLFSADYDKKGTAKHSTKNNNPEMEFIPPGSIGESLYKAVCNPNN